MRANVSYIETMERYHDNRENIQRLLLSILESFTDPEILQSTNDQQLMVDNLVAVYPYVDMLYTLSPEGEQCTDNAISTRSKKRIKPLLINDCIDRTHRPYYQMVRDVDSIIVTEPYLSITDGSLVVSSARKLFNSDGSLAGIVVCDFNLVELMSTLMGDGRRKKFVPFFNIVYSTIVVGLLLVMCVLLFKAFNEIAHFFGDLSHNSLRPFTAIIYFTLGLSIFDLAKTVLEEEVLMHKDIFRHSSTRRTITRFISAILIAVSIEALLLMFKSTLGNGSHLIEAVWMMLAAVGLLAALGFYVYMGAQAERILLQSKQYVMKNSRR